MLLHPEAFNSQNEKILLHAVLAYVFIFSCGKIVSGKFPRVHCSLRHDEFLYSSPLRSCWKMSKNDR